MAEITNDQLLSFLKDHFETDVLNWIKNNQENKEPERDWEILTFRGIKDDQYITLRDNGHYRDKRLQEPGSVSLNSMLNTGRCVRSGDYTIHQVRRLSDGEVFTVGDRVLPEKENKIGYIKTFEVTTSNKIAVGLSPTENLAELWYPELLNNLSKPKQLLFTTEDGVPVYPGQNVKTVEKNRFIINDWCCIPDSQCEPFREFNDYWYFSTQETAEEFVRNNKRLYSYLDVCKAFDEAHINSVSVNDVLIKIADSRM